MKFSKTVLGLALAGAVALSPAAASAQQHPIEPYYLSAKILYSSQSMDDFSSRGKYTGYFGHSTGTYKGKDASDSSFGGGLAIGYDFAVYGAAPVRLELEYLYRGKAKGKYGDKMTRVDDYGDSPATAIFGSNHSFEANIHTVFANAYMDFHNDSNFTPYIGLGIGGAYVDAKTTIRQTFAMGDSRGYNITDDNYYYITDGYIREGTHTYYGQQNSWNVAWNVGAGFAYQVTDNIALDLNYRYSDFGEADFGTTGFGLSGAAKNPSYNKNTDPPDQTIPPNIATNLGGYSGKSKVNLTAHEFILGLRFTGY